MTRHPSKAKNKSKQVVKKAAAPAGKSKRLPAPASKMHSASMKALVAPKSKDGHRPG